VRLRKKTDETECSCLITAGRMASRVQTCHRGSSTAHCFWLVCSTATLHDNIVERCCSDISASAVSRHAQRGRGSHCKAAIRGWGVQHISQVYDMQLPYKILLCSSNRELALASTNCNALHHAREYMCPTVICMINW
jgi:hypothetical protein